MMVAVEYVEPEFKVSCPACGRKLADVPQGEHTLLTAERKCRGCGKQWRVTVRPTGLTQGMTDEVKWQQLHPPVVQDWP